MTCDEITPRSAKLRAHCAKYYSSKTDCKGCAIATICWNGPIGRLSPEKLDAHNRAMNSAVEALS